MRRVRVLVLVLVVTATGLLSGGAAGADTTAAALVAAARGALLPVAAGAGPAAPAAAPALLPLAAPGRAAGSARQRAEARRTVPGTPCMAMADACIELSSNRSWLIRNGAVVYGPVPITHGRKGFSTPPGMFRVSFKNIDHVSSIYDAPMPYSVFFNGGIAFHQGSLRELSHGCIHLSRAAAKTYFGALSRGDLVQVVR